MKNVEGHVARTGDFSGISRNCNSGTSVRREPSNKNIIALGPRNGLEFSV